MMVGTVAEYIILAFNIGFMIYSLYIEKKVLKNDTRAAEKLIKSKEFFIYLEEKIYKKDILPVGKLEANKVENGIDGEVKKTIKMSKISVTPQAVTNLSKKDNIDHKESKEKLEEQTNENVNEHQQYSPKNQQDSNDKIV